MKVQLNLKSSLQDDTRSGRIVVDMARQTVTLADRTSSVEMIEKENMVEALDANGELWRMHVLDKNSDGTFSVGAPDAFPKKLLNTLASKPQRFEVGSTMEAVDDNQHWWTVVISAVSPDGTYAVNVLDGFDTKWPKVSAEALWPASSTTPICRPQCRASSSIDWRYNFQSGKATLQDLESPPKLEIEASRKYLVNRGTLLGEHFGLYYNPAKRLDHRIKTPEGLMVAQWGSVVEGTDEGDGWLRVGSYFLPMRYHDVDVLLPSSVTEQEQAEIGETRLQPGQEQAEAAAAVKNTIQASPAPRIEAAVTILEEAAERKAAASKVRCQCFPMRSLSSRQREVRAVRSAGDIAMPKEEYVDMREELSALQQDLAEAKQSLAALKEPPPEVSTATSSKACHPVTGLSGLELASACDACPFEPAVSFDCLSARSVPESIVKAVKKFQDRPSAVDAECWGFLLVRGEVDAKQAWDRAEEFALPPDSDSEGDEPAASPERSKPLSKSWCTVRETHDLLVLGLDRLASGTSTSFTSLLPLVADDLCASKADYIHQNKLYETFEELFALSFPAEDATTSPILSECSKLRRKGSKLLPARIAEFAVTAAETSKEYATRWHDLQEMCSMVNVFFPRAVVLVASREGARRAAEAARQLGATCCAVDCSLPHLQQLEELHKALPALITSTPGDLHAFLRCDANSNESKTSMSLSKVVRLVLDNRNQLLELGSKDDLTTISNMACNRRLTMAFSSGSNNTRIALLLDFLRPSALQISVHRQHLEPRLHSRVQGSQQDALKEVVKTSAAESETTIGAAKAATMQSSSDQGGNLGEMDKSTGGGDAGAESEVAGTQEHLEQPDVGEEQLEQLDPDVDTQCPADVTTVEADMPPQPRAKPQFRHPGKAKKPSAKQAQQIRATAGRLLGVSKKAAPK